MKQSLALPLLLLAAGCGCAGEEAAQQPGNSPTDTSPAVEADAETTPLPDDAATGAAPPFLVPELLGRPTDTSVAVNLVPAEELELFLEHGTMPGDYPVAGPSGIYPAGEPLVVRLEGLQPDTTHVNRVRWRRPGESTFAAGPERSFHTRRAAGSPFTFTLQADSHLDEKSDLELYRRTLADVLADHPDFHIDLGDTFMCEKYEVALQAEATPASDEASVLRRYLYERGHFGLITPEVPLFLVNGNHEGENGWLLKGQGNDLPTWTARARLRYFLNPVPDGFYTGDPGEEPHLGQRASWYAWEWGDALFVVLDPYWSTRKNSRKDGWAWTLGETQYAWLGRTLSASRSAFKLIFVHHLVGGLDGQGRGGVEAAPYFEWGGRDLDGTERFEQERPGWGRPIHRLLVEQGVTAVFHGHDHLYARQELDGIVYQEVPQPSNPDYRSGDKLALEYHYASGTVQSSSGHLRVSVSPRELTVEYVRAYRPRDENTTRQSGEIAEAWSIPPGGRR